MGDSPEEAVAKGTMVNGAANAVENEKLSMESDTSQSAPGPVQVQVRHA
jgi:hypothetical protein